MKTKASPISSYKRNRSGSVLSQSVQTLLTSRCYTTQKRKGSPKETKKATPGRQLQAAAHLKCGEHKLSAARYVPCLPRKSLPFFVNMRSTPRNIPTRKFQESSLRARHFSGILSIANRSFPRTKNSASAGATSLLCTVPPVATSIRMSAEIAKTRRNAENALRVPPTLCRSRTRDPNGSSCFRLQHITSETHPPSSSQNSPT